MKNFSENLKDFQANQFELSSILGEASKVTGRLNMPVENELCSLSEKVRNDSFKVMVTGTFKNGKSALINAMLGESILPSYALPCTAVINEIKYGAEKKAILHFKKRLPSPLPKELAPRAVQHMEKYKGQEIPPIEIPYDEIKDYVVIPVGSDAEQMKLQSPYEKVEVFYPLEILKNGIEIIDSPGMNEDEVRTQTTMSYLEHVDAILYVLNAEAIMAADELRFVENDLAGNNFDAVIFAINRIDLIDESERASIHEFAAQKLKGIYPGAPLFSISAKQALNGKRNLDDMLLRQSGFTELESHLSVFLTRNRGKAKLEQPAKRLRHILSVEAGEKAIPTERAMLEHSLDDIKRKQAEIQQRVESLQKEKDLKRTALDAKIQRCSRSMERMAKRKVMDIANSIPAWIDEYQPKTSVPAIPTQKKLEPITTEILDFVKKKIKEEQLSWQNKIVKPEIEAESKGIFEDAEKGFGEIFDEIDALQVEISGVDTSQSKKVPFWERVAGVAGGIWLGDIGLAVSGGINGIGKEFAKTAAFEIGAGAALYCLGLLNPFTILATLVLIIMNNIVNGKKRALADLKSTVSTEVSSTIRENADSQSQKLADLVSEKLGRIADQIADAVNKELSGVVKQLDVVRREKEAGESTCNKRRLELTECEDIIRKLNSRLDSLIFKLAEL